MTRDEAFLKAIRALPCLVCAREGDTEAHHLKTKRCYGDDAWNVIPLCRHHHRSHEGWHGGQWTFMRAHPHLVAHLESLGWDIDVSRETMFHEAYAVPKGLQAPSEE